MSDEQVSTPAEGGGTTAAPPDAGALAAMDFDAYASVPAEQRRAALRGEAPPAKEVPLETANGGNGHAKPEEGERVEGETYIDADGKVRDAQTGRFVPYAAYGKLQGKLSETKKAVREETERRARAEGRLDELSKVLGLALAGDEPKQAAPVEEEPQPVDPKEDIVGALAYAIKKAEKLEKTLAERDTTQAQAAAHKKATDYYRADIEATLKAVPEFPEAYEFLKIAKGKELEARGITDPTERDKWLARAERRILEEAMEDGGSACRELLGRAYAAGYRPKANGAAAPAAKSPAAEKIESLQEKVKASASLSGVGGGEGGKGLDLVRMSQADYEKVRSTVSKSDLRKLLGG